MKILHFVFCFLLCLPLIQAQTEFAPVGASWTYQKAGFAPGSVEIEVITVTGIDTIDGQACKRLEGNFLCAGESVEHIYQDGSKIYRYGGGTFNLLYDFAALPGTSWTIENLPHEPSLLTVLVDSITQLSVNNDLVDVQHISLIQDIPKDWCWGTQQIIDGVGMFGMLFPEIGTCDPYVQGLRCYESELVNYNFTNIACDSTWLLLNNNVLTEEVNINIFPNPTADKVFVESVHSNLAIQIFDAMGKHLTTTNESTIDINTWPNGIYYLKILQEEQILKTSKIVKY